MFGVIGKFFTGGGVSMWATIALVVAIGGYIGVLKFDNMKLENKVTELRNDVRELQLDVEREKGNVRTCQARVDGANARLDDLKSVSDSRTKIIEMLGDNIDMFREASNARLDNLRDAVVGESCEAAMEFLREGIGDHR